MLIVPAALRALVVGSWVSPRTGSIDTGTGRALAADEQHPAVGRRFAE
jgi:hypothetical protein